MKTEPIRADLLISGGHVVTADAKWRVFSAGAVAVADGRIVAVGSASELRSKVAARDTINVGGCLVVPGLIDAHIHPGYAIVSPLSAKRDWSKPGPFALGGDIAGFLTTYGRIDRAAVTEDET